MYGLPSALSAFVIFWERTLALISEKFERDWQAQPFRNSLSALAAIAARQAGAEGYAYFAKNSETGSLRRLTACGVPIAEAAVTEGSRLPGLAIYPLRGNGAVDRLLAFKFGDSTETPERSAQLDGIVETIASVWGASEAGRRYRRLIERVRELETRLLDSKIADRARGFLLSGGDSGAPEKIARHVDGVLRPTATQHVLEKMVQELELEIEERRIVSLAKGVLQATTGMSEEQAHAYLRSQSRRSRTPLRDVAQRVLEWNPPHPVDPSGAPAREAS